MADEIPDELLITLTPEGQRQADDVHRKAGGKMKKQSKRPMRTQSRADVRGKGQGRGAQKGARGKSGGKRRPSPRKGTK